MTPPRPVQPAPDAGAARRDELATGLAAAEERIATACRESGRDRAELTLVVVTKTYPASDVGLLAGLGVSDVGEARHPEAGRKAEECAAAGLDQLSWHFVGAVQTNKAAAVASYASLVHSVDRLRLVRALDRGAERAERVLDCLVQVDLHPASDGGSDQSSAGARSGVAPAVAADLTSAVATAAGLRLRGVMGMAPLDGDPAAAFARLAEVAEVVRGDHSSAVVVSAGMSGDLEAAVAAGATHLRVGRAVLGERPPLR